MKNRECCCCWQIRNMITARHVTYVSYSRPKRRDFKFWILCTQTQVDEVFQGTCKRNEQTSSVSCKWWHTINLENWQSFSLWRWQHATAAGPFRHHARIALWFFFTAKVRNYAELQVYYSIIVFKNNHDTFIDDRIELFESWFCRTEKIFTKRCIGIFVLTQLTDCINATHIFLHLNPPSSLRNIGECWLIVVVILSLRLLSK